MKGLLDVGLEEPRMQIITGDRLMKTKKKTKRCWICSLTDSLQFTTPSGDGFFNPTWGVEVVDVIRDD